MIEEAISFIMDKVMMVSLFSAIIIFTWIAIKSRSARTFQFQISLFLLIWICGELFHVLDPQILEKSDQMDGVSHLIHLAAMIIFAMIILLRFFYSKRTEKNIADGDHADFYLD